MVRFKNCSAQERAFPEISLVFPQISVQLSFCPCLKGFGEQLVVYYEQTHSTLYTSILNCSLFKILLYTNPSSTHRTLLE